METNFFGVLALTRAVLPTMRDRRQGRIVAVSSISGFVATPGFSVYGASKWALEGWAEALACEVVPFGIDVTLIEPGTYRTGIWNSSTVPFRMRRALITRLTGARRIRVRFPEDDDRMSRTRRPVACWSGVSYYGLPGVGADAQDGER